MRVCLVTPFSWSVPHEVNDHVAGVAAELRKLGHRVTVLAPSGKAADLREGRRSLADGADAELIALGPSVPISRRTSMGVPVGSRASLTIALTRGGYDVVHGFEPGLPSLSYLALRHARTISVASFFSPERLGYPPAKAQRDRLLAGGRAGGRRAVPRRLPRALARRRHEALPPGPEAAADRARVARPRASARPQRDPDARRVARLGARPAPHPAVLRAAVRPPAARPPRPLTARAEPCRAGAVA